MGPNAPRRHFTTHEWPVSKRLLRRRFGAGPCAYGRIAKSPTMKPAASALQWLGTPAHTHCWRNDLGGNR